MKTKRNSNGYIKAILLSLAAATVIDIVLHYDEVQQKLQAGRQMLQTIAHTDTVQQKKTVLITTSILRFLLHS